MHRACVRCGISSGSSDNCSDNTKWLKGAARSSIPRAVVVPCLSLRIRPALATTEGHVPAVS